MATSGGVEARRPGGESNLPPEVVDALPAVVGVHTTIPENRRSAQTLGSEREGHGIVIDDDGPGRHHRLPDHGSRHHHRDGQREAAPCRPRSSATTTRAASAWSARPAAAGQADAVRRFRQPDRCAARPMSRASAARRRRSRSRSPAGGNSPATGNTCSTTRSSPCRPIRCGAARRWSAWTARCWASAPCSCRKRSAPARRPSRATCTCRSTG